MPGAPNNPSTGVSAASARARRIETPVVTDGDGEQDLLREYRQLEEQYSRCAQALATAAHDLRTPLSVVSGYIELLMSGKLGALNEKQNACLEDMYASSQRLGRLITD